MADEKLLKKMQDLRFDDPTLKAIKKMAQATHPLTETMRAMERHSSIAQFGCVANSVGKTGRPSLVFVTPAVHAGASDVTTRRRCEESSICNRSPNCRRKPFDTVVTREIIASILDGRLTDPNGLPDSIFER